MFVLLKKNTSNLSSFIKNHYLCSRKQVWRDLSKLATTEKNAKNNIPFCSAAPLLLYLYSYA